MAVQVHTVKRPAPPATGKMRSPRIALIGNPNCGKTTLFNALTGSNQYVGNWPGVTVEKKEGRASLQGQPYTLVDLPGIYSLSPYTMEEIVASDFLIKERPDAVLDIVDGTNLSRNLYLTMQLLELDIPVVVAVNMIDDVQAAGGSIDTAAMSQLLGVPVLPIAARRGQGVEALMAAVLRAGRRTGPPIDHDKRVRRARSAVAQLLPPELPHRAYVVSQLLAGRREVLHAHHIAPRQIAEIGAQLERAYGKKSDIESILAADRYDQIDLVIAAAFTPGPRAGKETVTDRIDRVVTHRYLAIPIFFAVMALMFAVTFGPVGATLSGLVERFITDVLTPAVTALLAGAGTPAWVQGLLVDGVITGVGGILTFLPQIMLLFLFLSVLESSGYMARASFVMDGLLRKMGLTGKSFIPMLMGFGCTTPAVMATKTLENEEDRRLTIMVTPFMSCGAKLPIYGLFAGALFPAHAGLTVFSMYLLGLAVAICSGILLKKTVFHQNASPFIMELPPYRLPSLRNTGLLMWEKCRGFLVKAGTIILSMSVLIWFLQHFDLSLRLVGDTSASMLAGLGRCIAPVLAPLGFGTWQAAVALLAGLVAKEAVVSTLAVLYGVQVGSTALLQIIGASFTPASAYAFMVFCLLYVPCMAAFATIIKEMGSLKWALKAALFQVGTAYLVSYMAYQFARLAMILC
ncbi:Ferrous iron transport protein B [Anaerotruncus sp. 2789STDY5834896]|uniref:Ferrous iron transport protein B n=1 Tax=uncultured Anaerotruncus sp. TaxID=905011 RepID=A0A1C6K6M8_9FIRM|nr:Ferrous iron transport protein B [uncultured Anaerotruncus sp.]